MKMELYEYAQRLATICADLCPESFEANFILAKCYIQDKDYK